eukprot:768042_1
MASSPNEMNEWIGYIRSAIEICYKEEQKYDEALLSFKELEPKTSHYYYKKKIKHKEEENHAKSIDARNAATAAAQNRMQKKIKSNHSISNSPKITTMKKKMLNALTEMDNRQKEIEQMRQKRLQKGLSVE